MLSVARCFDPPPTSEPNVDKLELGRRGGTSVLKLMAAAAAVQDGSGFAALRIPKHNGGTRLVLKAVPEVHKQQAAVKKVLDDLYSPPPYVHGYVAGRDNFTNAVPHLGRSVVLRVDLRSFFPSVESSRLAGTLDQHKLDSETQAIILDLACVNETLATGFPTGPVLSNMAFTDTDADLSILAHDRGLGYTRYADDLTFSGSTIDDHTLRAVEAILRDHGWTINESKTRFMRAGGPQFVTGLYVGLPDRPRVPRRMKRRLRQQLHYLSNYGYTDCHNRVPWTMGHKMTTGWLNYISHVEPELGERLKEQAAAIDFELPRRIGFDDEWDAWLDEIGVPEDL